MDDRQLLRHTVATLAYRAGKALRDAPAHFADFTVAAGTRTPAQILALDAYLDSDEPLGWSAERLFQGPVADALTHTGQLTLLRRLAGAPIKGENYAKATITAGTLGAAPAAPRVEFD